MKTILLPARLTRHQQLIDTYGIPVDVEEALPEIVEVINAVPKILSRARALIDLHYADMEGLSYITSQQWQDAVDDLSSALAVLEKPE